jgi:hypothetical protein
VLDQIAGALAIHPIGALHDPSLEHLWVIYPGQHEYALSDPIRALRLHALPDLAASLKEKNS